MAKYIALVNWTDQGVRNAGETVTRTEQARKAFAPLGVNIDNIYWTIGRYDLVAEFDAPDDAAVAAALLQLAAAGNVRTETMRAFSADEMSAILGKMA